MDIGIKIRRLRENIKMPQSELAQQLGVTQGTLHNIESGITRKVDFSLMDKVCDIFDKDLSYFANDSVVNNTVTDNKGQVSINCENVTVNNQYPESILAEIQNLINENKLLKDKISELTS